jgi:hypothetical protein
VSVLFRGSAVWAIVIRHRRLHGSAELLRWALVEPRGSPQTAIWDMTNGLRPMAPVIGRGWRPICGFAEPYASVSGKDPGSSLGNLRPSRPAPRKAVRFGSARSGRFQLALWAGFTCVPGDFGQLARWPNHLKGRGQGLQNRRPSAQLAQRKGGGPPPCFELPDPNRSRREACDTDVAGIRRGISSCAGGASCRRRRLRFGSLFGLFNGQHLAEGGLLFRQFPTVIGEQCFTD